MYVAVLPAYMFVRHVFTVPLNQEVGFSSSGANYRRSLVGTEPMSSARVSVNHLSGPYCYFKMEFCVPQADLEVLILLIVSLSSALVHRASSRIARAT